MELLLYGNIIFTITPPTTVSQLAFPETLRFGPYSYSFGAFVLFFRYTGEMSEKSE